jgi:DNA replicative helicase MCM subunit Mcm2 (Cdc46/Mcm family)
VPQVSERSLDSTTKHILERLEHIKESFGLAEVAMSRGQLLDADSHGRSLSTLRLARSTARAEWREKVTAGEIKRAWDRVLEPALKEFIELTELKSEARSQWADERRFDKVNTRVLRAVRRLDPGTSGALGPTLDEIAAESGTERHIAAGELSKMKDAGILYEPRPGHFRLV